jgi:hypothetical protein
MITVIVIVVGLFSLVGLVYILLVAFDAKHDVATAPRTDMFLCPKHGAFPARYVYHLTDATSEPIEMCPMCFEQRMKDNLDKYK